MTWSDVTVGSGTQKRITAVKDAVRAGLTLMYSNGLLQSIADPYGRTPALWLYRRGR